MKRTVIAIAATLLFIAAQSRSAEPMGRFFFTPAQRTQLDTARNEHSRGIVTQEPAESAPPPEIVTYGGMVRRSDGKSTVWINNHPVQGRDAGGIAIERVRPDGVVTLKVPQTNRNVQLKVGQSVDVVSGTIEDPFDRKVAAPKPAPGPTLPATAANRATANTGAVSQRPEHAPDVKDEPDKAAPPGTAGRVPAATSSGSGKRY